MMKISPSPKTAIQVEITGPGGRIFSGLVPGAVLKLDHCVLELGGGASRFAFFKKGVIECCTEPESRAFDISEGCLSIHEGQLTLICSCAEPCECAPCTCGDAKPTSPIYNEHHC